jgi:hypothetical protein
MGTIASLAPEWLEPLRAYPRWLVLLCVAVVTAGLLALLARPLKWGLYLGLVGVGALGLLGFAAWLES